MYGHLCMFVAIEACIWAACMSCMIDRRWVGCGRGGTGVVVGVVAVVVAPAALHRPACMLLASSLARIGCGKGT